MAIRENTQKPTNRTLRQLGWIVAGCLALIGNLLGPSPAVLWLQLAGAALFALATVRPSALRPIYAAFVFGARSLLGFVRGFAKDDNDRRPPVSPSHRGQVANTGV